MSKTTETTASCFRQGKEDAFLGCPLRLAIVNSAWKKAYEEGLHEGERLRQAAQEVDAYRQELSEQRAILVEDTHEIFLSPTAS